MEELNKKEIAAQLKEAANLLDVLGDDAFRAKAFMNAARQIEAFDGNILELLRDDKLTSIRGVGKGVAAELAHLKTQEVLPGLIDLHERVPEEVRDLFKVSGLGAKKIKVLWQNEISGLAGLIEAVKDGRVAALKGFGAKSAEKFATAARFAIEAKRKMRLDVAEALSNAVQQQLQEKLPNAKIDIAGEYRRRCETISSLEFVVANANMASVHNAMSEISTPLDSEANILCFEIEGRLVNITLVDLSNFGTTLILKTGNDAYLGGLKEKAAEMGLELTDQTLLKDGQQLNIDCENPFYETLQLPWLVPELREEKSPGYPLNILKSSDIKGQIHNHSTWSDAVHSIREMVQACINDGYSYLAMADHSKTSYYANGLSEERVIAQAQEIADIRQELEDTGSQFQLLHGIEVDIMTDGSLDYNDDIMDLLDYAVVSVHQNFTLSEEDQTRRIIKAIQHPKASILAHPTGRILLRRPEYAVDQNAIIDACAETGTIIEINASPYRLDMDWRWVKKAKAKGCKFSINPDAHHIDQLAVTKYGVMMARKAGLTKEDVVNTSETSEGFLRQLKHRKNKLSS